MPRIYDTQEEPMDYCRDCWVYVCGFSPDDEGDDHPAFEDTDYTCEACGTPLSEEDN